MQKQLVYVPVSVETLPDKEDRYGVLVDGVLDSVYFNGKRFELPTHLEPYLIHYLRPTTAFILSEEEWEAYEKCIEALKESRDALVMLTLLDKSDMTKDTIEKVEAALKQLLSQLK